MSRIGRKGWIVLLWGIILLGGGAALAALGQSKAVAAEPLSSKALGARQAPVMIEVYSDFQCPACRFLYQGTLRPLIDNYVASGKVYLIHRDFPLENTHKHARLAARYANAAAKIGKFEKVSEALYAKQDLWSVDGNVDAIVAGALAPAEMKRVRKLVQSGGLDEAIDQDVRLGGRIPVRQTPTVIVTHRGRAYPLPPGGVTYSLLRQLIDDLLRQ